MADWTSAVPTWQPEWMRSTTRARLVLCRAAREGRRTRFSLLAEDFERVIPAADNRSQVAEMCSRWDDHGFPPISG
ncbi:hypothetical protein [Acidovorax sp. FG27]|uniref:hypothetical protein n=1 Tax=Acidovorax sp. FG27 TaxID=3133652 RepID=UPI0030E89C7A